jgi:hypothetical protein
VFASPSARRIATSAEKSHPLSSVAQVATVLNDIVTFSVGGTFLELHCLLTHYAANEIDQRAFVVVQWESLVVDCLHETDLLSTSPGKGCAYWATIARQIARSGYFPFAVL